MPGSSIKGAIKSAIIFNLIKKENYIEDLNDVFDALKTKTEIDEIERKLDNLNQKIENDIFNKLTLSDEKNDAVNSIMKGLIVSVILIQ